MKQQFRQAQKMESVGRLAGGVAHDFNNMIGIIMGNTELVLEDTDPATPAHHHLKEILKAAKRSSALTRQLLAFARKQSISPRVLDLNQTIEGMLKMLRRLIGEDIDLSWHPDKALWTVKVDASQVDQILANLCVNARDAIHDVGAVSIRTRNARIDSKFCRTHAEGRTGDFVVIGIRDTGSGMDPHTRDHLFEPFFTTKEPGWDWQRCMASFNRMTGLFQWTVHRAGAAHLRFTCLSTVKAIHTRITVLPGITI